MFDTRDICLGIVSRTGNCESDFEKNAGIAATMLKKIRACKFFDAVFSIIRFNWCA